MDTTKTQEAFKVYERIRVQAWKKYKSSGVTHETLKVFEKTRNEAFDEYNRIVDEANL